MEGFTPLSPLPEIEHTSFEDVLREFSQCAVKDQQNNDSDYNNEDNSSDGNDDTASLLKESDSEDKNHGFGIFSHRRIPKRNSRAKPPKDPSRLHPWWVTREEAQTLKAQQREKEKQRRERSRPRSRSRSRSPSSRRRRRRGGEKEKEEEKEGDKSNSAESKNNRSKSRQKKQRNIATSPDLPSISEDRTFELQQNRRSLSYCSLRTLSLTSLLPPPSSAAPANSSRPTIRIVTSTDNGNDMTNGDREPTNCQEMMEVNNKENKQKSFKRFWEMMKR
ncbi:hypothetical protein VTN00DRAFT_8424 [Thermoascus crustaceus]|uniref:uncharacterized protein n=1 Tax=Thermoascus crustaceus TaxID=5088 RepID=UPI0037429C6A